MKRNYCTGVKMSRLSVLLLGLGFAWATPTTEVDAHKSLQEKVHSIEVRQGVEMGISIRSQFSSSEFYSEQDSANLAGTPNRERTEFTQLDLSFLFRPWAQTRADVVLRLHAGHQDFFNAAAKVVSVPWMQMDGRLGNYVFYQVGDIRQQFSPLTLYAPDVEILFEPEVFRRQRHMAKSQSYLQGNDRNLQGVNFQFRKGFTELFSELRMELLASRLRRIHNLDLAGYMGNLQPNEETFGSSQSSSLDRWLFAFNSEMFFARKSIYTGFSYLDQRDLNSSRTLQLSDSLPINPFGSEYDNQVLSGRAGVDVSTLLKMPNLIAELTAEYAQSITNYGIGETDGSAVALQVMGGYKTEKTFAGHAQVNFLSNDHAFYNPLAQTPSFLARRVLNTDKDPHTIKFGVQSPMYTTFDALYRFNPRFTPMAVGSPLSSGADDLKTRQSDSYQIAPFEKTGWNNAVLDGNELALVQEYFSDPVLQMSLPFGPATHNREGLQARLSMDALNKNIQVQTLFSQLKEKEASIIDNKAEFSEMGGGLLINAGGLLGWELPLQLSGSMVLGTREQGISKMESSFLNASLYYKYHVRFGVAAGLQQITQDWTSAPELFGVSLAKSNQVQWNVGLDYSLARNIWLSISYGQMQVANTYESSLGVDANGKLISGDDDGTPQLPYYYHAGPQVDANTAVSFEHEFRRSILEAMVNVDF